jgi:hypothetical protein
MKEEKSPSEKEIKTNKEEKTKELSTREKKLLKDLSKKFSKKLDKKMEEVLRQVRKETRKALQKVLEELDPTRATSKMKLRREAFMDNRISHASQGQEYGAEEIRVQIEPDELHMGDDLQVVDVGETEGKAGAKEDLEKPNKEDQSPLDDSSETKRRPLKTPKQKKEKGKNEKESASGPEIA